MINYICIYAFFLVGGEIFVSFGLRQRKKTLLKGMWEREKLEKKKMREIRERERKKTKKKKKKTREERVGGEREKSNFFFFK